MAGGSFLRCQKLLWGSFLEYQNHPYFGLGRDNGVIRRKPGTVGVHELYGHTPIRFIDEPSLGILSEGVNRLSAWVINMAGYEFPGTDQSGYNFPAHAVTPSIRRLSIPFALAMAYTDAAANEQDNKQAQQVEVFHFGCL